MDGIILQILGLARDAPGYFALTVGFTAVVFAMYLKVRSVNIDEVTSIGRLQSEQVGLLLAQVSQLSKDLAAARAEISSLYTKIDELENLVRVYRKKLKGSETEEPDEPEEVV